MKTLDLYKEMSAKTNEYFECQMPILNESEKAICFDADNSHLTNQHRGVWIPKSQMVIITISDSDTRYFIKNWLYSKLK